MFKRYFKKLKIQKQMNKAIWETLKNQGKKPAYIFLTESWFYTMFPDAPEDSKDCKYKGVPVYLYPTNKEK